MAVGLSTNRPEDIEEWPCYTIWWFVLEVISDGLEAEKTENETTKGEPVRFEPGTIKPLQKLRFCPACSLENGNKIKGFRLSWQQAAVTFVGSKSCTSRHKK